MKIKILQYIKLDRQPGQVEPSPRMGVYREYESDIIPHSGDYISDAGFFEETHRKVSSVTLNYSENTCEVNLETYRVDGTIDDLKYHVQRMVDHYWICPDLK